MEPYILLGLLGLVVGALGTLIGAGGGFILTPVLLLLYPDESPEVITSISLAVVCANATSGSFAYARRRLIDYRSGIRFAIASLPGAIGGALVTPLIPRHAFDLLCGSVLAVGALWLIGRTFIARGTHVSSPGRGATQRIHLDATGQRYEWTYNRMLGYFASAVIGFASSLLGIGGGIIHVPTMVYALHFPVAIAAATSHFVLALMAAAGTSVHIATGTFHSGLRRTAALAVGVIAGAQIGARLAHRVKGEWILRGLAIALLVVGVRVLWMGFTP